MVFFFFCVSILAAAVAQATSAQEVGDMYKKCKFWSLSGFPTKLEFNKSNYGAFQCNEVFRSYRMSGKVHCQLLDQGMSGFIPPFDGYAFDAPTNDALVKEFLSVCWNKNGNPHRHFQVFLKNNYKNLKALSDPDKFKQPFL